MPVGAGGYWGVGGAKVEFGGWGEKTGTREFGYQPVMSAGAMILQS